MMTGIWWLDIPCIIISAWVGWMLCVKILKHGATLYKDGFRWLGGSICCLGLVSYIPFISGIVKNTNEIETYHLIYVGVYLMLSSCRVITLNLSSGTVKKLERCGYKVTAKVLECGCVVLDGILCSFAIFVFLTGLKMLPSF